MERSQPPEGGASELRVEAVNRGGSMSNMQTEQEAEYKGERGRDRGDKVAEWDVAR